MKQLFQNLKTGEIELIDTPAPVSARGQVVIATRCSLISAGTERMLNSFAKGGYIAKARSQPDKVRQVMEKARTDGLVATYQAVTQRLDQPMPLGYSNVGTIIETGGDCGDLKVGQRVVSNGPHSECVRVAREPCHADPRWCG